MFLLEHGTAQRLAVICRHQVLRMQIIQLGLDTVFIPRERRVGHSAAAMTDGSGRVLLLGGYLNSNTAEIVPGKKSEEEKKTLSMNDKPINTNRLHS